MTNKVVESLPISGIFRESVIAICVGSYLWDSGQHAAEVVQWGRGHVPHKGCPGRAKFDRIHDVEK